MRRQSRLRRLYRAATATRRARLVTVAAALAVAGGVVGGVVSQTGGGGAKPVTKVALVSQNGFEALVKTLDRPVYWVGPQPGADYELTVEPDGRIFLRYLPASSQAEAGKTYLSVGTYPLADAFATTTRSAGKNGLVPLEAGDGVAAVYAPNRPTNVYLAFRGVDYQVELFDPRPGVARKLVGERRVVPVP